LLSLQISAQHKKHEMRAVWIATVANIDWPSKPGLPADVQRTELIRLLDRAVTLTRPGGRLVYCTCSLQKAEGEDQVTALLARHGDDLALDPIRPEEVGVPEALTARGEFRALPHQLPGDTPRLSGWGGFFAARFVRSSR
jgi:16S rRNA (cytosine967-C5)-methyltransferase